MSHEFPLLDIVDGLHDVTTILEDCCREDRRQTSV
jgi:hypothetical protein